MSRVLGTGHISQHTKLKDLAQVCNDRRGDTACPDVIYDKAGRGNSRYQSPNMHRALASSFKLSRSDRNFKQIEFHKKNDSIGRRENKIS